MQYNDKKLRRLFAALSPSARKKAIKGACRKVGNSVRKVAVNNLRASGINHADRLRKGIRTVVFNREAGFRITVAPRKANRKGKGKSNLSVADRDEYDKPILMWLELGTKWRRVRTDRKTVFKSKGKWYTNRTRHRGFIRSQKIIAKTQNQVRYKVGFQLKSEIATKIQQIAKKHGCT